MPGIKVIAKWVGKIMLLLLFVLLLGYVFIYFNTEKRLNKTYRFPQEALTIPSDSPSIRKGKHLYGIRGCADCHGAKLAGTVFMNDPLLLQITAPNLTTGKGGLPPGYSSGDWVRVLRHGVDKHGKSLWMMPAHESAVLNKEDLANLIAYCQSVPAVDHQQEKLKKIGPVGRVLMVIDRVPVLPAERINHEMPVAAGAPSGTIEIGKYLASTCQGCHMPNMKGGSPLAPGFPPVPDISASGAPGKWTAGAFINTFRTGKTPEGKQLRNEFMPWRNMQYFTNEELSAILDYLKSIN